VAEEISKYKLDLAGVQAVRWDGGCTEPAGEYTFFYGKGNEIHELGTGIIIHKKIISAVKRVEFVSDRMSYTILRGRWCNIIVLNVHAPTEEKIYYMKYRFYEEPYEHLLRDFSAKAGREEILKPTIWNKSLHEISNDKEVRAVNFATSKNPIVKSTMFPHYNIHKIYLDIS
jgi:hypothetical protein